VMVMCDFTAPKSDGSNRHRGHMEKLGGGGGPDGSASRKSDVG
jgi:hypothetical protein